MSTGERVVQGVALILAAAVLGGLTVAGMAAWEWWEEGREEAEAGAELCRAWRQAETAWTERWELEQRARRDLRGWEVLRELDPRVPQRRAAAAGARAARWCADYDEGTHADRRQEGEG